MMTGSVQMGPIGPVATETDKGKVIQEPERTPWPGQPR